MSKMADVDIEQKEQARAFNDKELEHLEQEYVAPFTLLKDRSPEDYQEIVAEAESREHDLDNGWEPYND